MCLEIDGHFSEFAMFSYSERGISFAFSRDARFAAPKETTADVTKEEAMKIVTIRFLVCACFLQTNKQYKIFHLLKLHIDFVLSNSNTHKTRAANDRVIVRGEDIIATKLAIGITERHSLDDISLRVGVDGSSRSHLLSGNLEHSSKLNHQLVLLHLGSNTDRSRASHSMMN